MPPKRAKKSDEAVFEGMVVAVSGNFTVSQGAIKKLLEDNGATIAGSVTKKVRFGSSLCSFRSYLVYLFHRNTFASFNVCLSLLPKASSFRRWSYFRYHSLSLTWK